jgi:endonuclease YncB( thermonuclease family)
VDLNAVFGAVRRRTFLGAMTASTLGAGVATSAEFDVRGAAAAAANRQVSELLLDSTSSLLNASEELLTDDSAIAVWASDSATNTDQDGNGDAVSYPAETPIPIVASEGPAVGVGNVLVHDGTEYPPDNANFLLNVFDAHVDGTTVLWDEGHGQFYTLTGEAEGTGEGFSGFASQASDAGYQLQSTQDVEADLDDADGIVVTTPSEALSQSELSTLATFAADGGAVVLLSQSDFNDFDATDNLNEIASALDVPFRFNDDQVVDEQANGGAPFLPTTTQFNDSFPYFGQGGQQDPPGIDFQQGESYDAVITTVDDGDTVSARFSDGGVATLRLLGVDTPETPSAAEFERPEEWEGLGDENDPTSGLGDNGLASVQFGQTCSLLNAAGEPLSDGETVAVWAEPTATNDDAEGGGDDAVVYPSSHPIPLAAAEESVVGFGSALVPDAAPTDRDNEEFLLNVWDASMDGSGTVLWEEGHDQAVTTDTVSNFVGYAESEGYDVQSTAALTDNLSTADAAVITSPGRSYTDSEREQLSTFVQERGALFLHCSNDFDGADGSGYLNEIASALDVSFRFNDDQVTDAQNNTGDVFLPTTGLFNHAFDFFGSRNGIDGAPSNPPDYGEYPYLAAWALNATNYTDVALSGTDVTVTFDETEPVRDGNDRLLAYVDYDADGSGSRDDSLNGQLLDHGFARVYDSSFTRHEEFWSREAAARSENRGLWAGSETSATPPIRNRTVEDVFVPNAVSVASTEGSLRSAQVPVYAGDSASPAGAPLVGLDKDSSLGVVGGMMIDEQYERDAGFAVDTAGLENFTLVLNVLAGLSSRGGDVLIDGGHGQFGADYSAAAEGVSFFNRYLEGFDIGLEGVNDNYEERLQNARAMLVAPPARDVPEETLSTWANFARGGGAVVLLGSAVAPAESRRRLDAVATALGSPLRFSDQRVTDASNNINDDERLPVTTRLNSEPSEDLFTPYEAGKNLFIDTSPQTTTTQAPSTDAPTTAPPTTAPETTAASGDDGGDGGGSGLPGPGIVGSIAGLLGGIELARRRRRDDED